MLNKSILKIIYGEFCLFFAKSFSDILTETRYNLKLKKKKPTKICFQ